MTNILYKHLPPLKKSILSYLPNVNATEAKSEMTNTQFKVFMTVEKEMLLWKLIDGECTEQEEREVKRMISINDEWRREYETMLQMHYSFKELLGKKRDRRIGDRNKE